MGQCQCKIYLQVQRFLAGLILIAVSTAQLSAQNLVPNSSFEMYTECPLTINTGSYFPVSSWTSAGPGTADYFNGCAGFPVGVPDNFRGYQYANTGFAYAGMYFWSEGSLLREYIQVQLTQPLVAGVCYKVGYYLNLSNTSCGVNQAGALLTTDPNGWSIGTPPSVNFGGQFYSDTLNWKFVFDYYLATGGEQYLTIGNFMGDPETSSDPACVNDPAFAYYYVDDAEVSIAPTGPINLELGGPITVCDQYLIDPGITEDVVYHWSDGSQGPTLWVNTTGTYSLTVSYGCNDYEDAIEVNIINPAPVDIGPPSIVLCAGDTYSVSLDPLLGEYEWNDGSMNPDYNITNAGTYTITMYDGCDLTSDTMVVSVFEPPSPFSLGQDTILCAGDNINYQFDPLLGNFEWQDGSTNNSYQVDGEGIYALTISNQCGEASDEIEITSVSPPDFLLGPDSVFLCSGDVLTIDLDPGIGNFLWQDGSTNSSYEITNAGNYSLTVTNVCGVGTGEINATYIDPPNVELGVMITACQGDTITLNGGNNTGIFMWQDSSSATSYQVTISGQYTLMVTNMCGIDKDTVDVSFDSPVIPPDLGPDVSLCPGDNVVFYVASPGTNILWNDLSTADTLLVTAPGQYYVNASNACSSYSDTVNVVINNSPPSLNLQADFALCQGQSSVIDASGVIGVTYIWQDGSTLPQITVSAPSQYSLTISNACGSDADTVNVTDGGAMPFVSLGNDTLICPGQPITITPVSHDVDSWMWQDGSVSPFYTTSAAGSINVAVTNVCGVAYDTLMIGLLPGAPTFTLGSDTSICPGTSLILSIGVPGVNILWSDGSTGNNFAVSDSAIVSATISNMCGQDIDTVNISILPDVASLDLGPDETICPGEIITLNPGIPGVNYLWQDGSTGSSFQVTQEGLITLTISNTCGVATDSIRITTSTMGPVVDLGPDISACEGTVVTIPAGINGVSYQWQDGSTGNSYVTSVSGTFILQVSNLCGVDKDTINVDITGTPPVPFLGNDTTLCHGNTYLLSSNADPLTTSVWQDGTTGPDFLITSAGIYSITQSNQCGNGTDSIVIGYVDAPVPFDLGQDTTLCPGESIILTSPLTSNTMQWQDGSQSSQFIADAANTYWLQVSNSCGSVSDSIVISYDQDMPVVDLGPSPEWCQGNVFTFDASQPFPATYSWNTGATTPMIEVNTTGHYSVEVSAHCGDATDEVDVIANTDCPSGEIFIPNIISPNGDNVNDIFTISMGPDVELESIHGEIFDRWGNQVFNSDAIPFTWDGRFHNETLQPAVYVYKFSVKYRVNGDEFDKVFRGDVTLVK